jgi:hypothetical protein
MMKGNASQAGMDPRSQEMRPQGLRFLETEEEIVELSTVLTPWAGNAATTTTANLEPTRQGTELDSHDLLRMSQSRPDVNSRAVSELELTWQKHPVKL